MSMSTKPLVCKWCVCRMRELVGDLQQRLEGGEKLLVHCWGGRGRTGMAGACLLASMYQ